MAPQIPSLEEWRSLSSSLGFDLDDETLLQMSAQSAGTFAGYARMDELPDDSLPVAYPRPDAGYRPIGEDNPHNGWAWKCSIKGADSGVLKGKRVGIKDNIAVAGMPLLNGSAMMQGYLPNEDATVVTRILQAGGEIAGKTVVPAYCFDGAAVTCFPGPQPTNPHNPDYCAGGSSAGSAIVLITGEADMAVGGDNGGSIRIPASWSGCYGLKPTWGLVPWTGAFSIETTIDHLGPMAMNVEDCATLLSVMAGPDGLDPRQKDVPYVDYAAGLNPDAKGLRIGIVSEAFGWDGMSQPDVDAAVREAALRYASLGATVEEVSIPMHRDGIVVWSAIAHEGGTYKMVVSNAMGTNAKGYYSTRLAEAYGKARGAQSRDYPNTVKLTAMIGAYMSKRYNNAYYAKGQNLSRRLTAAYNAMLENYDVLVLPTTPMKAMPQLSGDSMAEYFATTLGMLTNTAPFNISGHPAISVPVGTSQGLPIGMTIVGRHFNDQKVLSAALAFQQNLA